MPSVQLLYQLVSKRLLCFHHFFFLNAKCIFFDIKPVMSPSSGFSFSFLYELNLHWNDLDFALITQDWTEFEDSLGLIGLNYLR